MAGEVSLWLRIPCIGVQRNSCPSSQHLVLRFSTLKNAVQQSMICGGAAVVKLPCRSSWKLTAVADDMGKANESNAHRPGTGSCTPIFSAKEGEVS